MGLKLLMLKCLLVERAVALCVLPCLEVAFICPSCYGLLSGIASCC